MKNLNTKAALCTAIYLAIGGAVIYGLGMTLRAFPQFSTVVAVFASLAGAFYLLASIFDSFKSRLQDKENQKRLDAKKLLENERRQAELEAFLKNTKK